MGNNFVENNKNLTDEVLIEKINNGDYELLAVIIDRYYPVIFYYAQKYCPAEYVEDAVQEATYALYSAVRDCDLKKSSFNTFASLCIKRSVFTFLKAHNRKKNIPDELVSPIDDLQIADSNTPEKIFFDRENYKSLANSIKLELSELEYKVLQFYLAGAKYSDIAVKLQISEKAVDNALLRIRKKLKDK